MKTLFLIRHAKSSWKQSGLPDHDRPLANRGKRQLKLMAPLIQAAGAFDGPVFCSTACRARQTLAGLLGELDRPVVALDHALYTFDWNDLLDWLADRDEDRLTLIGHNPALEDLAAYALQKTTKHMPTCAFMHIEVASTQWTQLPAQDSRLLAFVTPKTAQA